MSLSVNVSQCICFYVCEHVCACVRVHASMSTNVSKCVGVLCVVLVAPSLGRFAARRTTTKVIAMPHSEDGAAAVTLR